MGGGASGTGRFLFGMMFVEDCCKKADYFYMEVSGKYEVKCEV